MRIPSQCTETYQVFIIFEISGPAVLVWVSSEANYEARIWVQVVNLGSDSQKSCWESRLGKEAKKRMHCKARCSGGQVQLDLTGLIEHPKLPCSSQLPELHIPVSCSCPLTCVVSAAVALWPDAQWLSWDLSLSSLSLFSLHWIPFSRSYTCSFSHFTPSFW